jgi:hypothetical protein
MWGKKGGVGGFVAGWIGPVLLAWDWSYAGPWLGEEAVSDLRVTTIRHY